MATRQILVDDLSGQPGEDVQTVTFGLDGKTYELDLNAANRAALRDTIEPYLEKARGARRSRTKVTRQSSGSLAPLRHWARLNGFQVGDRGRIPAHVREAYTASQQS